MSTIASISSRYFAILERYSDKSKIWSRANRKLSLDFAVDWIRGSRRKNRYIFGFNHLDFDTWESSSHRKSGLRSPVVTDFTHFKTEMIETQPPSFHFLPRNNINSLSLLITYIIHQTDRKWNASHTFHSMTCKMEIGNLFPISFGPFVCGLSIAVIVINQSWMHFTRRPYSQACTNSCWTTATYHTDASQHFHSSGQRFLHCFHWPFLAVCRINKFLNINLMLFACAGNERTDIKMSICIHSLIVLMVFACPKPKYVKKCVEYLFCIYCNVSNVQNERTMQSAMNT